MLIELTLLLVGIFFITSFSIKLLGMSLMILTKSSRMTIFLLSLILLPGTFLHEVAHFIFAELLLVRTHDLNFFPVIAENKEVRLGSVSMESAGAIRKTIIALAPIIFGLLLIWFITYLLKPFESIWWYKLFFIYLLFEITHSMFSSKKDLEGAFLGLFFIVILFFVIRFFASYVAFSFLTDYLDQINNFIQSQAGSLRLGLRYGLIIDSATLFVFFLFSRFVQRR